MGEQIGNYLRAPHSTDVHVTLAPVAPRTLKTNRSSRHISRTCHQFQLCTQQLVHVAAVVSKSHAELGLFCSAMLARLLQAGPAIHHLHLPHCETHTPHFVHRPGV